MKLTKKEREERLSVIKRKTQAETGFTHNALRHFDSAGDGRRWTDPLSMELARERISVSTADPFSTLAHAPHAVRLALGSVDLATLKRSLETVAQVLARQIY